MSDLIVFDDGLIRTLRMNRPAKKNALTLAMYDAMAAAVDLVSLCGHLASM
jgi:enoyl-CoA hydratase/carnithine racemase